MRTESGAPMVRYDDDLYGWALAQAAAVRDGRWADIDVDNLSEEIDDMAGSVKRELRSRLDVLLAHILKKNYQPERESRSWKLTIVEQGRRISDLFEESPSLRSQLPAVAMKAYDDARYEAARETGLDLETFPETMPAEVERELRQHVRFPLPG
jgi:hypothetical protein